MMSSYPAFLSSFTVSFSGSRAEGKCEDRDMMNYVVNGYRSVHNFSPPGNIKKAGFTFFLGPEWKYGLHIKFLQLMFLFILVINQLNAKILNL